MITSTFGIKIGIIGSYLLTFMIIEYTMVINGILFAGIILLFFQYMKTRIGLKPEEYIKKILHR